MHRTFNGRLAVTLTAIAASAAAGDVVHQHAKLMPDDGGPGNYFGYASAIDGGVVAVGAYGHRHLGLQSGSVYLYDDAGQQLRELLALDGQAGDSFGYAVGIDDGTVVIGAVADDDNGDSSGSAYLFDAATGAQLHKLLPNDGSVQDDFGVSVAIDGTIAVVGARYEDAGDLNTGSVYLFDTSSGTQLRKLFANDRNAEDRFGTSVAIEDELVVVGSPYDDDRGARSGSAYIFSAASGAQLHKLVPADGAGNDYFGHRVAIDGGLVAVSAYGDGDYRGAVYVFDAATGAQLRKLVPADVASGDGFGSYGLDIDDGLVTAGSPWDTPHGAGSGSGYLFDANTGEELSKLLPSDGASGDNFGFSTGIDNGVVVCGAYYAEGLGTPSGVAYVYDLRPPGPCNPADLAEPYGQLDLDDVSAFVDAFISGDLAADLNDDLLLDLSDVIAFTSAFIAGCP